MNAEARAALRAARDALQQEIDALAAQAAAVDAILGDAILGDAILGDAILEAAARPALPAPPRTRKGAAQPAARPKGIDRAEILRRSAAGESTAGIARALGTSRTAIYYHLRAAGLSAGDRAAAAPRAPAAKAAPRAPAAREPGDRLAAPAGTVAISTIRTAIKWAEDKGVAVTALAGSRYAVGRENFDRSQLLIFINMRRAADLLPPFHLEAV